ncbi:MAG: hypothetical protein ED556_13475 [Winogradskyella sp.]|uniref:hypothetical protein n=1 Tax=Winogradskyella sp. TaxID=1883156 RepID=UPI000F3E3E2C|nr:hypothetical protein [Winogradskyella sp.]RNC83558.1 MAG: hypothetical protein ED556_13475 [Winogradskyella sp.]
MKKITSTIIALVVTSVLSAQVFDIESSIAYKKPHKNSTSEVVLASPYGCFTYSYLKNVFLDNQKEITITKYDQTLSAFETKRFTLPKLDLRAADLDKVIELDNKLVFISNSMSKKKGIRNIYAQVFDGETSTVSDTKIIASYTIESYSKSGQIEVNVSENKQQIVVLANMPFVKKTKQKIKVWTFDTNLEKIWEASYDLSLDSERAHNQDLHISNDGAVYLVKRYKYNSKKAVSLLITISKDTIAETVLSQANFFVRNTAFTNLGLEHLITGFYYTGKVPNVDNNSDKGNETSGVFMYNISSEKLIGKHDFRVDNKPVKGLNSVAPIFTHVFGEDIYIVGEKQTSSSKFKPGNSAEVDYLYNHGPTIAINMDINGTLKDMQLLNNKNTYKNELSERASVSVLPFDNGLRLFYNNSTLRIASFYKREEEMTTWKTPEKEFDDDEIRATPVMTLLPKSLRRVNNYNLIYFVSTNADLFWINKMTW